MEKIKKKYAVAISYISREEDEITMDLVTFITDDLEKSIEQYGRNREPFEWKVVREKELTKEELNEKDK